MTEPQPTRNVQPNETGEVEEAFTKITGRLPFREYQNLLTEIGIVRESLISSAFYEANGRDGGKTYEVMQEDCMGNPRVRQVRIEEPILRGGVRETKTDEEIDLARKIVDSLGLAWTPNRQAVVLSAIRESRAGVKET